MPMGPGIGLLFDMGLIQILDRERVGILAALLCDSKLRRTNTLSGGPYRGTDSPALHTVTHGTRLGVNCHTATTRTDCPRPG